MRNEHRTKPAPNASQAAAPGGETYSIAGIALFGIASFLAFALGIFDTGPVGIISPGVCTLLAWVAFGVHLVLIGRHLGAFDFAIWLPVLMLFHYFGMAVAVEWLAPDQFPFYDPFGIGIPPKLDQSFLVALIALLSFLFGMHVAGWRSAGGRPDPSPPKPDARFVGAAWTLLVLSMLMTFVGIPIAGRELIFGSYNELKMAQKLASADTRFFFTGTLLATGGIIALIACYRPGHRLRLYAPVASAVFIGLILVLTGDRTGLAVIAFGAGWAYSQRVRRAPWSATLAGYFVALLLMPMIGEFREYRDVQDTRHLSIRGLAANTFFEMGSTLGVFGYTIEHIPKDKGYDWGLSVVSALVNNIPNVGLTPGRFFALDTDPRSHNPGQWVTFMANPTKWEINKGGYANAIAAEWYFNFGLIGVFLGMTLTGFAAGRIRNRARDGPIWLTFSGLFYVMLVISVRNAISYPLRCILWPMVFLLVVRAVWPASNRRAAMPLEASSGAPR